MRCHHGRALGRGHPWGWGVRWPSALRVELTSCPGLIPGSGAGEGDSWAHESESWTLILDTVG